MSSLFSLPQEEINVSTFSYRCAQLEGLISESANFLVLRVMARRQSLPQNAIFLSFDSDQHVCTSTYVSSGCGYIIMEQLGIQQYSGNSVLERNYRLVVVHMFCPRKVPMLVLASLDKNWGNLPESLIK